jgi:hypothetical protein
MTRAFWTTLAHAFRRTALPLAAYYAVTLALPLANGAAASGAAFVRHALVVLAVPPILIVVACGLCAAANSGWSHIQRPPQQSSSWVRLLNTGVDPRRNRRSVAARRSP